MSDIRTMSKHLGIALMPARLAGAALGIFGLLGLVLASVGMYGVMAYTVSQRRREIGIRMAIGAAAGDVVGMIMKQGLSAGDHRCRDRRGRRARGEPIAARDPV